MVSRPAVSQALNYTQFTHLGPAQGYSLAYHPAVDLPVLCRSGFAIALCPFWLAGCYSFRLHQDRPGQRAAGIPGDLAPRGTQRHDPGADAFGLAAAGADRRLGSHRSDFRYRWHGIFEPGVNHCS